MMLVLEKPRTAERSGWERTGFRGRVGQAVNEHGEFRTRTWAGSNSPGDVGEILYRLSNCECASMKRP